MCEDTENLDALLMEYSKTDENHEEQIDAKDNRLELFFGRTNSIDNYDV